MNSSQEVRHLLVIEDQKSRRIVPLTESTYAVGRDPNSAIILYDRQVSRHHATLLRVIDPDPKNNQYSYRIIDGNLQGKRSTNGILINGNYCLSHELKNGDSIRFGTKSQIKYQIISQETELDSLKSGELKADETLDLLPLLPQNENNVPAPVALDKSTYAPQELELMDDDEPNTSLIFNQKPKEENNGALSHLSSLAEYSPNPIIEIDYKGQITYLNPAAKIKFSQLTSTHPLLQDIIKEIPHQEGTSYVREIEVGEDFFEQHVYYLNEGKIIRSYIVDISKHRKLENQLLLNKERYQLLVKAASEGILVIDAETKEVVEANATYRSLLGYDLTEILELNLYKLIALDRDILNEELEQIKPNSSFPIEESFHRRKDGSFVSVMAQVTRTIYHEKEVFCWAVRDVGDLKKTEEQLRYQSLHDSLTNLPNRMFFEQQLDKALVHAQKHQHLLAVLFLDLDSFAHINSTLGHQVGDRILRAFSKRIDNCTRAGDIVSRWGSDEYTLLLPQIKNTDDVVSVMDKIFESLNKPFQIEDKLLHIKVSVGIAIYPQDGEDKLALLKNADAALHRTKVQGRNHYQFYHPTLTQEAALLMNLENLIHQALERRQFSLYYQPQIHLATGEVQGMEALLRWEHPELGFIPPEKFIPIAQKTDILIPVCQWILKTACEQNLSWQKDGISPLPVAINLSAREFAQENLVETIAHTLNDTGLDPQWLEIEITEKTLRKHLTIAPTLFQNLRQLGVHITLDDFGTGYSALGFLQQFPFHTIKLDQNLIHQFRGTPQEKGMISAIVALCKGYNLRLIVEGVETQKQVDELAELHCKLFQGYWFSQPLTAKQATQFLVDKIHGNT
ncbi:MAG: EAL domain-containing protein [Microcystaceae cyanobacterium]